MAERKRSINEQSPRVQKNVDKLKGLNDQITELNKKLSEAETLAETKTKEATAAEQRANQAEAEKNKRPTRLTTLLTSSASAVTAAALTLTLAGGFSRTGELPKPTETTKSLVTNTPISSRESINTPQLTKNIGLQATVTATLEISKTLAPTPEKNQASNFKLEGETKIINGWNIQLTDQAKKSEHYSQLENIIKNIQALQPEKWSTTPNINNPQMPSFDPANGIEIPDVGLRNYGQEADNKVINPVAPWHYMDYTGVYSLTNLPFSAKGGIYGDILAVFNLGDNVTTQLQGRFSQGWRQTGRFYNGDRLDQTIPALVGHTANNMLNLKSELNPSRGNAGGNCNNVDGCSSVFARVLIMDGDKLLAVIENQTKK